MAVATDCRGALLGTPDYLKLEKAVRRAGMESSTEPSPVIGAAEAEESLAWFRSRDVPHFRVPEPPGRHGDPLQSGPVYSTTAYDGGA